MKRRLVEIKITRHGKNLIDVQHIAGDEKPSLADLGSLFNAVREVVDLLPAGRMRSLAITHLEDAATRVCFAASECEDPLRPKEG